MRRIATLVALASLLCGCWTPVTAQTYLDGYQGPYTGRVVDAETGEPLAGAVVAGIWRRERILPLHSRTEFYAALEVLTQADGSFVMDARDIEERAPLRTLPSYFYVFSPEYATLDSSPFFQRGFLRGRFQTGVTIGLPRLRTKDERRDLLSRISPFRLSDAPFKDVPNFVRLFNVEAVALGLPPYRQEP